MEDKRIIKIEDMNKEQIENEIQLLTIKAEVETTSEEDEALDFVAKENKMILKTIKFIKDSVSSALSKKERKLRDKRLYDLAVLEREMKGIENCDTQLKMKAMELYFKDKQHDRTSKIRMFIAKIVGFGGISVVGGTAAALELLPRIFGGF